MGNKTKYFSKASRKRNYRDVLAKAREAKRCKTTETDEVSMADNRIDLAPMGESPSPYVTIGSGTCHTNDMDITRCETNNFISEFNDMETEFNDMETEINDMDTETNDKDTEINDLDTEIIAYTIETETLPRVCAPIEGRRIVDFQYFFEKMKSISQHNPAFGCTINNLEVIKEKQLGLESQFIFQCNMCNSKFKIQNTDSAESKNMKINNGAVMGAMMIGCGMSNVNEFLASMDLPNIKQKTYTKCHDEQAKWWQAAAEESMLEAAKEEAAEAIKCGHVNNGIPVITVVADCCWLKRSYKTNYSASSGVAAIIGYKTGKVLYMDVKNKYCVVCAKAAVKSQPPAPHNCLKNHSGSSTSMEQAVIVEGFRTSIATRNLIYGTLIADGDASTYKKILECRPYPHLQVEKIECSNHLLRNYAGKLLILTKNTAVPLAERKCLTTERITRLRTAVKAAARYRKALDIPVAEKIINLKRDLLNAPKHVFGDHSGCDRYYCSDERKTEENLVPKLKTLLGKIMEHTTYIALHSKSLLHDVNNNRAEQFNSIVAKLVGGKRVNFSLKNSYTARCHAAVVSFNTARPQYTVYKHKLFNSPGKSLKKIEMARFNRKQKIQPRRLFKRRIVIDKEKGHYGEDCQRPDMTEQQYETAKNIFLDTLKKQVNNRHEIERDTVLQAESALWLELRRCLLTASSFSKVCKRRPQTNAAPLVKSLLYSYSLQNVPSVQHGKEYESVALRQLAVQEKITVEKCGLFVDETEFFLGASPDATFEGGIIEIKCPSSAYGTNPDKAIKQKKIKFWKVDGTINKRHDWYYQVQGQLHITKNELCLFAVWTGAKFPLKVERIKKDDLFWAHEMEPKLISFYNKCLLKEIVDPRKARNMPLRINTY